MGGRPEHQGICLCVGSEKSTTPWQQFSSLKEILSEALNGGTRLGLSGKWDMPGPIYDRVLHAVSRDRDR